LGGCATSPTGLSKESREGELCSCRRGRDYRFTGVTRTLNFSFLYDTNREGKFKTKGVGLSKKAQQV